MADEIKTGKPPQGPGGPGLKKAEEGTVEAHGYKVYFDCWNCHFTNAVDSSWTWFKCWHCGATNYTT